ncbi:MAG: type II toxin-antitoxin system prevent-host-death family antitoxin [Spirochaeta sp.]|jgi:antitoxin (DNA-binding transcriptional repressor) of toxin-antitoxin stability system|nr:type II toxin-antitoxin system prevent-host-death family antitoxin [Spirochaeta sp.]
MKTVNTHEAKTHLSRILQEVSEGEVYIISRNGVPVAELRKREQKERTTVDPILSRTVLNYDPIEDLANNEWGDID